MFLYDYKTSNFSVIHKIGFSGNKLFKYSHIFIAIIVFPVPVGNYIINEKLPSLNDFLKLSTVYN